MRCPFYEVVLEGLSSLALHLAMENVGGNFLNIAHRRMSGIVVIMLESPSHRYHTTGASPNVAHTSAPSPYTRSTLGLDSYNQ